MKMLRSGFGSQTKSTNQSLPSWGFGTSCRDAATKQYISPEHAKVSQGNNSQGPVYKTYSAIGNQPESRVATAPVVGFGTSARSQKLGKSGVPGPGAYKSEQSLGVQKESMRSTSPRPVFGTARRSEVQKVYLDDELMKQWYGKESPGPNMYNVPTSIGKQPDSKRESAPTWRQGTEPRFKYDFIDRAKELPGAGQYNSTQALGKQNQSEKTSLPSYSIGTSTREHSKKAYLSKEHEKQNFGEASPGPAGASSTSAFGSQTISKRNTSSSWGFGTAQRIKSYNNDMPGPGSYYA